jgi:hypothetical protein
MAQTGRPTCAMPPRAKGRISKGPAGYREVGCATLTFCDDNGDMLGAIRMAHAPEPNKRTRQLPWLDACDEPFLDVI